MDDERTEELRAVAHEVVATANVAGELDDQTFTMGIARKRIAAQMGLREDGLDEKPWKKMVKELVETALENVTTGKVEPSPIIERQKRTKSWGKEAEASPPPKARAKKSKAPVVESDGEDDEGKHSVKAGNAESEAGKSDSEMSVLIDEPPKKKRKSDAGGKAASTKKRRSTSARSEREIDSSEDVLPAVKKQQAKQSASTIVEDPKVKELKAIVGACGVRKVWKKELADKETVKSQIAQLQAILSDLGMKGQPTKAKAVAIKKKRELAAELGDIMEFEKTRGLGTADKEVDAPARPRRAAAPKKLQEVLSGSDSEPVADDDDEEEEEEEDSESEVEYASDASEDEEEEGIKKRQRKRAASTPGETSGDEDC